MHTQAPRGPEKPQNLTDEALSAGVPKNVVLRTSQPQVSPVSDAPSCSSRWGRVQNVSRPTVRCHEMSQMRPVTMKAEDSITAANVKVRSEINGLAAARLADEALSSDSAALRPPAPTGRAVCVTSVAIRSTLRELALIRQTHTHAGA